MDLRIDGRIVVVTGAAGRIGRGFCEAIASAGGTAVLGDTAVAEVEGLAAGLRQRYGEKAAVPAPFDMTCAEAIDGVIDRLHAAFGRIDAVVNNAYPRNAAYGRKLEEVTYADFNDNVGLHLGGYFVTSQRFARYFVNQGHGHIVNMGSIYGVVAPRFEIYEGTSMTMPVEYAVIKAGLLHLTRYFAQYFKSRGLRINAISPGGVESGQSTGFIEKYTQYTMNHRMLGAGDLAGTLLFLLSDASAHITGQNLVVDDGWTL